MTTPITAGTSLEDVLRDMLEKYNVTTIALNKLAEPRKTQMVRILTSMLSHRMKHWRWGRDSECKWIHLHHCRQQSDRRHFRILLGRSTIIESGFSDDNATKNLASVFEEDPSSPTSASFKVKAVDNGGSSAVSIGSGTIAVNWRYRIRVGASSTETITSNTEAGTLWSGMSLAYNQLRAEQDFNVTATSAMDTADNYTWIAYPASFGNLNKINLAGTDVLSDFESPVDYNITNDYGVTTSYRFYRSTYDNAFLRLDKY